MPPPTFTGDLMAKETKMDYKPRTEFLKHKMAEARSGNRRRTEYIIVLCEIEDEAYRKQVKHEPVEGYGSYSHLHPEQFGAYRNEYFAMLKELSHDDYIRYMKLMNILLTVKSFCLRPI